MRLYYKPFFEPLVGLLFAFLSFDGLAQSIDVDEVRVGASDIGSRVVLEFSDKAEYRFFRLGDPERLVLDIYDTKLSSTRLPTDFTGTPVLALRHARRGGNDLRFVVDLPEGNYRTRHFTLPPDADNGLGHRLILDVSVLGESELLDTAGQSLPEEAPLSPVEPISRDAAPVDSVDPNVDGLVAVSPTLTDSGVEANQYPRTSEPKKSAESQQSPKAVKSPANRRPPKSGTLVDFSGTWQHEWAWAPESSSSQKFESIVQPRWDVRFENGLDLTAILRIRGDGVGDLGPNDRRPPNYSDVSAPWFNSGDFEISLREFFVDFQWGKTDWRLGKQQVVWGQADGIKVLDVVNPQSFREFILDDFDDSRIPLWTANVTVPLGDAASLQLLWIPDTTYHELAESGTPYFISTPRVIPQVPITASIEANKPDSPLSDGDAGFALSGFVGGWDLSLNYLYRYLDAPALPVRVRGPLAFQLEPEYQRSHLLGGSFSNAFGDVTLRGELAYNSDTFQPTNTLANAAIAESSELSTVIGLDWALSMDALISAQVFNSYLFDHLDTMGRDESEQTLTLLYQQDFANAAWRFRGIGIHSLNDGDSQIQFKLSYWWSSELQVWIGADVFSGDNTGLFGQFDNNDRALFGFEYGF